MISQLYITSTNVVLLTVRSQICLATGSYSSASVSVFRIWCLKFSAVANFFAPAPVFFFFLARGAQWKCVGAVVN